MAAKPGTRPKIVPVNQATVEQARSFFETLPEKPKEDLSLKQAVEKLRDQIVAALSKGYSYQDLAAMLTDKGIKISAATLKNYVPSGKRQSSKGKAAAAAAAAAAEAKPRRTRKSQSEMATPAESTRETSDFASLTQAAAVDEPVLAVVSPPEMEPDEAEDDVAVDKPPRRKTGTTSRTKTTTRGRAKSEPKTTAPQRSTGGRGRKKTSNA